MPKKQRSPWVDTSTLAQELGCSGKHIRQNLKDEIFQSGRDYRNINPTAWRPTYRWHLPRCLKKFGAPPTDRADDLGGIVKEASYRLFCDRIGQSPNTQLGKMPTCPLLAGYRVGDRAVLNESTGQLVINVGAAGQRYVAFQHDVGMKQIFNQRAAADIQPLEGV